MFNKIHKIGGFLVLVLVVFAFSLPTNAMSPNAPLGDNVIVTPGNPIKIVFASCNGYPDYQDHLDALQMAIDDYGTIDGFSVQFTDYPTMCDETSGQNEANAIVSNTQNVGVVGPFFSSSTVGAAPIFESSNLVMISYASSMTDLPTYAPNVFNRTIIPDPIPDNWFSLLNLQPSAVSWRSDFNTLYGRDPDEIAILAYDATMILLTGIDEVSSVDGSGNLVIPRTALATDIRTTVNYPGASGHVTFQYNGDRVNNLTTAVWDDQFENTSLDPRWSWIDEDATHWSLSANPGHMRIITQQQNNNKLMQPVPSGDFEIRTYVLFEPSENFQGAALYVYGDEDNFLKIGRGFCDHAPPNCVGNGIYFDYTKDGELTGSNYATEVTEQSLVYLRLVSDGSNFTAFVSTNGTSWDEIGTHTISFTPSKIGLYVGNGKQPVSEIPADFDFFLVQYDLSRIYLPLTMR
jgi:hypothetical protein